MAKNEKKIPTIKGLVDSLIDKNKTVDENVAVLVEAFDKGEFGTLNIVNYKLNLVSITHLL